MATFTHAFRAVLVPFIAVTAALLVLLLILMILQRLVRMIAAARSRRIEGRYRPVVEGWMLEGHTASLEDLVRLCRPHHHRVVGRLLLAPLGSLSGTIVERSAAAMERLGLVDRWISELTDRRWWRRAEAAHALGLARIARATPGLTARLQDRHVEVRAAVIDALGRIADGSALPFLIELLADPAHILRERIIGALHGFRGNAVPSLVAWGRREQGDRALVADSLGLLGGDAALPALIDWCTDADPRVREAALKAVGTIGVNDEAYYVMLRALGDESVRVRAMAARALGRSRRADAAPYLAARLGDEWNVAAQAALSLRDLRAAGVPHLEAVAAGNGTGAGLARQMLWEAGRRA